MRSKNIPSLGYVLDIIIFHLYFHYFMFLRKLESFMDIVNRLVSSMFIRPRLRPSYTKKWIWLLL